MYARGISPQSVSSYASGRETQDDPDPPGSGSNSAAVGSDLSGELATDGEDFPGLFGTILQRQRKGRGKTRMMSRFCCYIVGKVFDFGERVREIHDSRERARIPTSAIWRSSGMWQALPLPRDLKRRYACSMPMRLSRGDDASLNNGLKTSKNMTGGGRPLSLSRNFLAVNSARRGTADGM